jgi:hypothetical protein
MYRDVLAFKIIAYKSSNATTCPIGERSVLKIATVISDMSSMAVF